MAAVDFFRRGRKQVTIAHFDQGTSFGAQARRFVEEYAKEHSIPICVDSIKSDKPIDQSWEEWWRNQRYEFLLSLAGTEPIVTAHHLDDACEWWLQSALHGEAKLIPPKNGRIIRPFLATPKQELQDWCHRRGIYYLDDPSNETTRFDRGIIRNKMIPLALQINPGLATVIRKKYKARCG